MFRIQSSPKRTWSYPVYRIQPTIRGMPVRCRSLKIFQYGGTPLSRWHSERKSGIQAMGPSSPLPTPFSQKQPKSRLLAMRKAFLSLRYFGPSQAKTKACQKAFLSVSCPSIAFGRSFSLIGNTH